LYVRIAIRTYNSRYARTIVIIQVRIVAAGGVHRGRFTNRPYSVVGIVSVVARITMRFREGRDISRPYGIGLVWLAFKNSTPELRQ